MELYGEGCSEKLWTWRKSDYIMNQEVTNITITISIYTITLACCD